MRAIKKKLLFIFAFFVLAISFLLYFYTFTATDEKNLNLSVDNNYSNGWKIYTKDNGTENEISASQALNTYKTVYLSRTADENWLAYSEIAVDTGRAMAIFVDDCLVFANHKTALTSPGEMDLMKKPANMPYTLVFSIQLEWVGKNVTVVTRFYEGKQFNSIGFELKSNTVLKRQHEAWTNTKAIPGAMFGLLALMLTGLFLFQLFTAKKGYSILLLAFAALLQMFISMSSLSANPFKFIDNSIATALYFLFPVLYLGTKMTKLRKPYFISALSIWGLYFLIFNITYNTNLQKPVWFDKAELLCLILAGVILLFCFIERRKNIFINQFLLLIFTFILGYILLFIVTAVVNKPINDYIKILFLEAGSLYLRPLMFWVYTTILFALFILALWDFLQSHINSAAQMERMQSEQTVLNLQMSAAKEQLNSLRLTQEQTIIYRHDMRHHLALLSSLARDGELGKIQDYLMSAKADIDAVTPLKFCKNETVNLVLSAFNTKAEMLNLTFNVDVNLPAAIAVTDTELCSLFSNALENAFKAVENISDTVKRSVSLTAVIKNDKLLISTKNAYEGNIETDGVFPVSQNHQDGHGFGLKSIVSIVERYGGLYSFEASNNIFVLRLIIPFK